MTELRMQHIGVVKSKIPDIYNARLSVGVGKGRSGHPATIHETDAFRSRERICLVEGVLSRVHPGC